MAVFNSNSANNQMLLMDRFITELTSAVHKMNMWDYQSEEELQWKKLFLPRESDVFIVTFPKCGTTWLQQIVFQLVTRCSTEHFEEISVVCPWLDYAQKFEQDIENWPTRRVFKTHMPWSELPDQIHRAKTIFCNRHWETAFQSYYHFFAGSAFTIGENCCDDQFRQWSFSQFCKIMNCENDYITMVQAAWPHRNDPSVLFLYYEDMCNDHLGTVMTIANFLGVVEGNYSSLDEENKDFVKEVVRRSSFAYMKAHEHQFDDHFFKEKAREKCGWTQDYWGSKVRKGHDESSSNSSSSSSSSLISSLWSELHRAEFRQKFSDAWHTFGAKTPYH